MWIIYKFRHNCSSNKRHTWNLENSIYCTVGFRFWHAPFLSCCIFGTDSFFKNGSLASRWPCHGTPYSVTNSSLCFVCFYTLSLKKGHLFINFHKSSISACVSMEYIKFLMIFFYHQSHFKPFQLSVLLLFCWFLW